MCPLPTCMQLPIKIFSPWLTYIVTAEGLLQIMPTLPCETAKDRFQRLKAYHACWTNLSSHMEVTSQSTCLQYTSRPKCQDDNSHSMEHPMNLYTKVNNVS